MKIKTNYIEFWGDVLRSAQKEIYIYNKKEERSHINYLSVHLKKLKHKEQNKSKANREK